MLSTVQIGITLVGIVAGAFGGARLAEPLDDALARMPGLAPFSAEIAYTLVVVAITYLSLIIGELVPKHLALRAPERVAALVAPTIDLVSRISTPAVWLLETSSRFVLRLLGSEAQPAETVTEEEVRTLIAEGTRAGVFHRQEQEMIGRVLRLADRPVRAIMTPRVELVWLDVEDEPDEIARIIRESGHSRFVVGKGSLDEVLGVVHVRGLLDACLAGRPLDLQAALRPMLVVPDSMPVSRALEALRQARVSMALVVDEYGEVEGVVTVEDVLEAVVGDMPERRLGEEPAIVRRGRRLDADGRHARDRRGEARARPRQPAGGGELPHARGLHPGPARPRARARARRSPTAAGASRSSTWTGGASTRCWCAARWPATRSLRRRGVRRAALGGSAGRQQPLDQARPVAGADGQRLVVEVVLRAVQRRLGPRRRP